MVPLAGECSGTFDQSVDGGVEMLGTWWLAPSVAMEIDTGFCSSFLNEFLSSRVVRDLSFVSERGASCQSRLC